MIDNIHGTHIAALPKPRQPTAKAVELFQRALAIQAANATREWEPRGRRIEYISIDAALMRELRGSVWGVSVLDVDENADGPPASLSHPWEIEWWREAISLRRALLQTLRARPDVIRPVIGLGPVDELDLRRDEERETRGLASITPTRIHFTFRVDRWDQPGENILEHVAGIEHFSIAVATFEAACKQWPTDIITLRQGTRVIEDSRKIGYA